MPPAAQAAAGPSSAALESAAGRRGGLPGAAHQPFVERLKLKRAPLARAMDVFGLVSAHHSPTRPGTEGLFGPAHLQPAHPPAHSCPQVVILVSARRHDFGGPLPAAGRLHLWAYGTACLLHTMWGAAAGCKPGSSYVRCMEASSAFLRLTALSHGAWLLQRCVSVAWSEL